MQICINASTFGHKNKICYLKEKKNYGFSKYKLIYESVGAKKKKER